METNKSIADHGVPSSIAESPCLICGKLAPAHVAVWVERRVTHRLCATHTLQEVILFSGLDLDLLVTLDEPADSPLWVKPTSPAPGGEDA